MKIGIQYDGSYPNLCSGTLIVTIGKKKWHFGDHVLSSGGGITDNYETILKGPWCIRDWPKDFPKKYMNEVIEAVNRTIPEGCCGGCI